VALASVDPQPAPHAPLGRVATSRRAPPKPSQAPEASPAAAPVAAPRVLVEADADADAEAEAETTTPAAGGSMFLSGSPAAPEGQLVAQMRAAVTAGEPGRLGRVSTSRKPAQASGRPAQDALAGVQRLCTRAHGAGLALEAVGDDLVDMGKELETWNAAFLTARAKLETERATTRQSIGVLLELVGGAESECEELEGKLAAAKAQMLANETELKKLLEDKYAAV
jgi:hypothetical protein